MTSIACYLGTPTSLDRRNSPRMHRPRHGARPGPEADQNLKGPDPAAARVVTALVPLARAINQPGAQVIPAVRVSVRHDVDVLGALSEQLERDGRLPV